MKGWGEVGCVEARSGSPPLTPCVRLPPWVLMPIITFMGVGVIAYLETPDTWWDAVLATQLCPHCLCLCRRHSVRERAAWTQFLLRISERIPVLRIYCPRCRHTYTILPDFLTPRHRYQVPVREAVVSGAEPLPACGAQTVTRWTRAFRQALPLAIHHVTSWMLTVVLPLSRPDQRFLTGTIRGLAGLRQARQLAVPYGFDGPASSVFGWVNQHCPPTQAFVL